jgi:hypothetical protein
MLTYCDQMQALAVIGATTIRPEITPKSANTGGTSKSDPDAGSDHAGEPPTVLEPVTTADRAGAGIVTVIGVVFIVGGSIWLIL